MTLLNILSKACQSCLFLLLLTGCASEYIPSSKNIPLFEKKGEVLLEAGVSTNSAHLNGSYAFSEKYALIANGNISYTAIAGQYIRSYNELTIFTDGDIPHYAFEAGIGRYNLITSSERRLEVFAGAAYGKSPYNFTDYPNLRYLQGFLQINTGNRRKYLETGWAFRSAYSVFQKTYFERTDNWNEYTLAHKNHPIFHLEPMFVVRVGGQHVKWFA